MIFARKVSLLQIIASGPPLISMLTEACTSSLADGRPTLFHDKSVEEFFSEVLSEYGLHSELHLFLCHVVRVRRQQIVVHTFFPIQGRRCGFQIR